MNHKRFIEESFPVKEVGEISAKEKNIRHGHISTLHIWWARRPLAASRATAYAALTPMPKDPLEWQKKRDFIIEISKWENSNREDLQKKAREEILKANNGQPPKVIDPFSGGGSYPLEALRLGCEAYANDYNPVAVLIEKATLEFPQKFRRWEVGNWQWGYKNGKLVPIKTNNGGTNDKSTELPGSRNLENEYGSSKGTLQDNQTFSTRGEICNNLTDPKSSSINSIEYSGRLGEKYNEGIHPISQNSQGISVRTGNTANSFSEYRISSEGEDRRDPSENNNDRQNDTFTHSLFGEEINHPPISNPLVAAVEYWGNWVLEQAKKELAEFYTSPNQGEIPVGYIWARTLPCQNPSCGVEIPLMRQYWLAKKGSEKKKNGKLGTGKRGKLISLIPLYNKERKRIEFAIIKKVNGTWEYLQSPPQWQSPLPHLQTFNPEEGTVARANVRCPACGAVIDDKTTRKLFQTGKSGERMIAVVYTLGNRKQEIGNSGTLPHSQSPIANSLSGKHYRLTTAKDLENFEKAKRALEKKVEELRTQWMMEPVPDEDMNEDDPTTVAGRGYGVKKWGDLFNARQKLSLLVFCDAVRRAYEEMRREWGIGERGWEMGNRNWELGKEEQQTLEEFAIAVDVYLSIGVNRVADYNSIQCIWHNSKELVAHTFGRQALQMTWDYIEINPFSNSTGNWSDSFDYLKNVLQHSSQIPNSQSPSPNPQPPTPTVTHSSATHLPYPDNYFDAVLTDPPYYDNVSYAALSDFFYVWLKRSVGHLFPELFATPLTPKSGEIIANVPLHKDKEKAKKFFEEQLALSFKEMYRILKPQGIAVIVYAHKSTAGWETVINALLDSGLVVNASWPINTEMQARLNAKETASLASSIYIVARKMERQETGFYTEVKDELKKYMNEKLDRLWAEGISGADFFISAIGAGIEVFGKYKQIMDYSGNSIRADVMLEDIRKLATDYAVHKILHNGFAGEINELTRYYVLYRWEYGEARIPFDEARKLATSCGIDLTEQWNKHSFIKKEKEFIRLLGPDERKLNDLEDSTELIDVLHHVLLLWEKGKRNELMERLQTSGFGRSEAFYRVAQAIAETLPLESKEKKLLEGFLAGRERIRSEMTKQTVAPKQEKLFDR